MVSQRQRYTGKSSQGKEDLSKMESFLDWTLEPISPRREFVENLRGRLAVPDPSSSKQLSTIEFIIFAAAGLFSSLILLIASVRAALALLEAIRFLRQSRHTIQQSKHISLT